MLRRSVVYVFPFPSPCILSFPIPLLLTRHLARAHRPSTMDMSLRLRRAGRKSSTPFFPGAWPTTPVHENLSETSMGHAECNEASGKSKRIVKQTSRSDNVDPPHLDHVVSFHKRISKSYPVFTRPRNPSEATGSAADSSSTQSPPMSPVLSVSVLIICV